MFVEGFIEPEIGAEPRVDLTVPEGAPYSIRLVEWIYLNEEDAGIMEEGDVFEDGVLYYMAIYLDISDGYAFSEDLFAYMNGREDLFEVINPMNYQELELLTYDYDFGAPDDGEYTSEIYIENFVEPEFGEAPFYGLTVPEDAPYRIVSVEWFRYDEDWEELPMGEDELFDDPDTFYFLRIKLEPTEDGPEIEPLADAYLNGSDEFVCYAGIEGDYYEIGTFEFEVFDPDAPEDPEDPDWPDDPEDPDEPIDWPEDPDEPIDWPDEPIAPYEPNVPTSEGTDISGGYISTGKGADITARPPVTGSRSVASLGVLMLLAGAALPLVLRKRGR